MARSEPLDRLYELLPALYREPEERAQRFPLRSLLRLITQQADIVHGDIEQLWNNFFIETCDHWAIPYIGDLVGNNLLHDAANGRAPDTAGSLFKDLSGRALLGGVRDLRPALAIRRRTDVAKTIYYRRRKGTLPMLEELARDVTGWAAHAVEFFELLDWTQNLNHRRDYCLECPDIRLIEPLDRINGPFDAASHSADVRPVSQEEGWYNIPNIGFFLWRLTSFPAERVVARRVGPAWRYYFSPLGNPAPIFSRFRREGAELQLAGELDVPAPIRRAAFYQDLESYRANLPPTPTHSEFYGTFEAVPGSLMPGCPDCSLVILADGTPVSPDRIYCRDLRTWSRPADDEVAVDVRLGRIALGADLSPRAVDVYYHYGFSADMGGGPYERAKWLVRPELATLRLTVAENGVAPVFPTLGLALAAWENQGRPNTIITILDNRTYAEPFQIRLRDDRWLVIQSENGKRAHLQPEGGLVVVSQDRPGSELTLSGLLVEGGIHVKGEIGRLRLLHSTLVPGRSLTESGGPGSLEPSIIVEAVDGNGDPLNAKCRVEIAFSISGPLRLPTHAAGLWVLDSIVDGLEQPDETRGTAIAATDTDDGSGPPATLERTTILGRSFFAKLRMASETIFVDPVQVIDRQDGCVRFSFVAHDSATPRRYRCQPNLEIDGEIDQAEADPAFAVMTAVQQDSTRAAIRNEVALWLVPTFTALSYGDPGYAQLRLSAPIQVRTGAEDGSEMGAFCHLKQPQRETNLRIRLEEYLPLGLDAGFIYVT